MNSQQIKGIVIVVCVLLAIAFGSSIVETVEKGTYQVRQWPVTGTLDTKMTPGMWMQMFGDISEWPKAETFYFTADKDSDQDSDQDLSIEVRFQDGSMANISGTLRIVLPTSDQQAINLIDISGYKNYRDLAQRLILPVVRNALRLSANLMSARESYSEKRTDFVFWSWDMIQNGLYQTEEIEEYVTDLISGEKVKKTIKVIKKDKKTKKVLYQQNPLKGTGITLANFEIKSFVYSKVVKKQIKEQQDAIMAIATAKALAQKAEQDKLKEEAQGKARVAKAKYQKEEEKIRAVVDAEKDKTVATLAAERKRDVAKLAKEEAAFTKAKDILLGQGEAERKKLVMAADGALKQKLDAYTTVMAKFATEFGKQKWVPEFSMNGTGGAENGSAAIDLINLLTAKTAKDLNLNLNIKK